jgi:hypothetical protein
MRLARRPSASSIQIWFSVPSRSHPTQKKHFAMGASRRTSLTRHPTVDKIEDARTLELNKVQQDSTSRPHLLKQKPLKIGHFRARPESALDTGALPSGASLDSATCKTEVLNSVEPCGTLGKARLQFRLHLPQRANGPRGVRIDSTRFSPSYYRGAHLPLGQGFTRWSVVQGIGRTACECWVARTTRSNRQSAGDFTELSVLDSQISYRTWRASEWWQGIYLMKSRPNGRRCAWVYTFFTHFNL